MLQWSILSESPSSCAAKASGSGVSGTDGKIKRLYKNATVKQALAVRGATAQNERAKAEKAVDEWVKKSGK